MDVTNAENLKGSSHNRQICASVAPRSTTCQELPPLQVKEHSFIVTIPSGPKRRHNTTVCINERKLAQCKQQSYLVINFWQKNHIIN